MKRWILLPLLLTAAPTFAGNWFGSGPWANATYYAGNLDGKYQAAVSGVNTSGVLGFAIRDGAPPFLDVETQSTSEFSDAVAVNQNIEIDRSLNYYAIFVNGRTYVGTTAAAINYDNSSVTGSLLGTQPSTLTNSTSEITSQLITNITPTITTNITQEITSQLITNAVPIVVTNTTNSIVSQTVTNIVVTNETIIITNSDGVVTETNVFYDLTNEQTVFFTNVIQVPEVIDTIQIIETVFFTNTTETPVIVTNSIVESVFFTNVLANPVVIATGVDGAFQATINGNRGIFTFSGPGQLTSPGPVVGGQQVNPQTAFNVNGIRVSFSSQATFQSVGGASAQQ